MIWLSSLGEFFKFLNMLIKWYREKDTFKSTYKRDALTKAMTAADKGDQDGVKEAINTFNSVK